MLVLRLAGALDGLDPDGAHRPFAVQGTIGESGRSGLQPGLGAGGAATLGLAGTSAAAAGFEIFTGAGAFALFVSFCFGSAWAGLGEETALTGLRAVAVLRAAVVLVVVFVAIGKF